MEKGQQGLASYNKMMEKIQDVLKKNGNLTSQLAQYQMNILEVSQKTSLIENGLQEINQDYDQNELQ
jgi:hypothetical protein